MAYNGQELEKLFTKVLNTKQEIVQTDEEDLVRYMNELFTDGYNPSSHDIHQFNNLIIKKADEIFRPQATQILNLLADFEKSPRGAFVYKIPKQFKATAVWAADGSSVTRTRVDGDETRTATPKRLQGGFFYEPHTLVNADAERFRELVQGIVDAKLKLYWEQISKLTQAAIANLDIPAKNVMIGANLDLKDYLKLGATLNRYGTEVTFVADSLLINKFAQQQVNNPIYLPTVSQQRQDDLFNQFTVATIGATRAVPLVNPFVDGSGNTQTELSVNEGYMFVGNVKQKPFKIIEFENMTQTTEYHGEIEQVELKFYQNVAIEFIQGEAVGYIKDTSVTV